METTISVLVRSDWDFDVHIYDFVLKCKKYLKLKKKSIKMAPIPGASVGRTVVAAVAAGRLLELLPCCCVGRVVIS